MTHMDYGREPALRADYYDRLRGGAVPPDVSSSLGAEQSMLDARALIDRLGLGNAIGGLHLKLAFPTQFLKHLTYH